MNIGKAIKLCRVRRGLSQVELGEKSSLNGSYISLIEQNARKPTTRTLEKIANALNVSMVVLTFLGSDQNELDELGIELCEKLSYAALKIIGGDDVDSN